MTNNKEIWETVAQPFERSHWEDAGVSVAVPDARRRKPRRARRSMSRRIWSNFRFSQHTLKGKTVLDIGPGPTGRCEWLKGDFVAIEPLAKHYGRGLGKYRKVYVQPAEDSIPELVGAIDAVLSLNCLDHCYDIKAILANVYAYLNPGGLAFFSFDVNKPDFDANHPTHLTAREATRIISASGLVVSHFESGHCYPGTPWLDSWGGGTAYHWWCQKPEAA